MSYYNVSKKEVECLFAWAQFYQNGPSLAVKRNEYIVQSPENIKRYVQVQKKIVELQNKMFSIK